MAIKIQTIHGSGTVENGRWSSSNSHFRNLVRGFDRQALDEEVGYHPWPDHGIAEMAIADMGGKIVEQTNEPKFVVGRVY